MEILYLNTDLEIESKSAVYKIVEHFGEDVLVHHHGEISGYQHASFSIRGGSTDANGTINFFCDLIESLPNEVREIWDECCSRVFDVGYESGRRLKTSGQKSGRLQSRVSPTLAPALRLQFIPNAEHRCRTTWMRAAGAPLATCLMRRRVL